jgi:hypothetical protein
MPADYEAHWTRFWPRRNWYRVAIYGASLPLLALALVMDRHPAIKPLTAGLLVAYLAVMVYWRWKLLSWPCPSCHRPFYRRWGAGIPVARRCTHCGAPVPERRGPA